MLDSGAKINIIFLGIMQQLGLWVDTTYGKCYSMDNRAIPVLGVLKNIELRLVACPDGIYR